MNLELTDKQKEILRHALETYLSDLRTEIVRTERREWKEALHAEEDVLKETIERLAA